MAKGKKQQSTRTPFVRLLPVLTGAAALMLSVRVHDIWLGLHHLESSVHVGSELEAQQPARGQGPAAPAGAATPAAATESAATQQANAVPPPATDAGGGQGGVSPSEMDVLQQLSDRRAQLDQRESELNRREALLKAASDQIDRKVAELKTLQSTIEGLLKQYNEQEEAKMQSLVKIYENMKPKDAAKIFEQLDMPILLDVVERMKEQRVAPILAEMDPSKARNVTAELAQRRQMPLPQPASGG